MTPAYAPSFAQDTSEARPIATERNWNRVFEIAIAVLIGAGFFLLLRATPDLPGGTDGYRHVKQAWRLITEPKATFADPWRLAYFWHVPVDAWFGFHLMLAPFAFVFDLITAIKLLTSVIFGLIAYVMFLLLRHLQANHRVFWVLLAMTGSSMTLSRAATVRPFLLSVLLTLLAALLTVQDKPVKLGVVSLIHAVSYTMFVLVGLAPALWFLLRRDRRSGVAVMCCAAGVVLGLLANPYFPENVRFDLVQANVMSIAHTAHVKIAAELAPPDSWWCIVSWLPAALPWLGAVVLRFSGRRRAANAPVTDLLMLISGALCLGTLRVVRTADFFMPFAILFAASVLTPYLKASRADLAVIGLLFSIPCAANVYLTHSYVLAAPSLDRFRGASAYLKVNAPDALVMNTEWAPDYFFLFFLNSRSRYVIGIDPTFMYLTNPRKYWFWRHIWADEPATCDHEHCASAEWTDIVSATRKELGAQYIVTDHANNPRLESILKKNTGVTEAYRDAALSVFRIDSCLGSGCPPPDVTAH